MIACVRSSRGDVHALLRISAHLTPRIERHPDALVLDLSGCERLIWGRTVLTHAGDGRYRGHQGVVLAQALRDGLAAVCLDPSSLRVGLGPTRTVAWLAAIAPTPAASAVVWRAVDPAQVAAFLRPLPVGVLASLPDLGGVSGVDETLAALTLSGIETLGQLVRLPVPALCRRFGPIGRMLATLAAGEDATPFRVWRPAAWIGARLRLDPPIEAAQLAPLLTPLAQHLAARLGQGRQEASALAVVVQTEDGATVRATRRLSHPLASPDALLNQAERLLTRLVDHEPRVVYETIHLRVGDLLPASARQEVLWRSQDERDRRAARRRLFAPDGPLAGRQGAATLLRAHLVAPDAVLPEEQYRLVPLSAA